MAPTPDVWGRVRVSLRWIRYPGQPHTASLSYADRSRDTMSWSAIPATHSLELARWCQLRLTFHSIVEQHTRRSEGREEAGGCSVVW